MAIINFRVNHLTERSGGAAQRVTRYLMREGEYTPKDVGYVLRTTEDTVERGDFVDKTHGHLPTWAQEDAAVFFAQAEAYERGGAKRAGRWATTWQIALPKELTREEQWTMGKAFVETYLAQHAYLCVMHDPVKDGEHQPHLHVIFSERIEDGKERKPAMYFRRPEVGGAAKDRWFSQRGSVAALREAWADWTNYTYERLGHPERVHPRSLHARDIDRKPEPKMGYSTALDLHETRATIRAQRNVVHEQSQAATGWEARKQRLQIENVREREPMTFLRETYVRTRQHEVGQWNPELARRKVERQRAYAHRRQDQFTQRVQSLEKGIHALDGYVGQVQRELDYEHHYAARGMDRPPGGQRNAERVLAEGASYGLLFDTDLDRRWDRPLLGNTQSRIYHTPEHTNYGDVSPSHQVWFWSEREAQDAGYRRAMNDHYGHGTGQAMTEREHGSSPSLQQERTGAPRPTSRIPELDLTTREPDEAHGHGVKVRIFRRERDREGYSR